MEDREKLSDNKKRQDSKTWMRQNGKKRECGCCSNEKRYRVRYGSRKDTGSASCISIILSWYGPNLSQTNESLNFLGITPLFCWNLDTQRWYIFSEALAIFLYSNTKDQSCNCILDANIMPKVKLLDDRNWHNHIINDTICPSNSQDSRSGLLLTVTYTHAPWNSYPNYEITLEQTDNSTCPNKETNSKCVHSNLRKE